MATHAHSDQAATLPTAAIRRTTLPHGEEIWAISGYDEAAAVLKDARFVTDFHSALTDEQIAALPSALRNADVYGRSLLLSDPPTHTRLRALVSKAFTPRVVAQLRPHIQQIADQLLDAVVARGAMDLIDDYAFPLPIIVISEMLGVPKSDQQQFRQWSEALVSQVGILAVSPERQAAIDGFTGYFRDLFVQRRRSPTDDLTSALVLAEEQGDHLSEEELSATVRLLLVAGHETTVNLIGSGVLALLQHPDQRERLEQDPTLLRGAIEELLRYTNPVHATFRWAREDLTLAGQPIARGERVVVLLAAANHDPALTAAPEALDLARESGRHLAFGQGIHYCLGAPLARVEGEIAIETLLRRLPGLRLAVAPEQLEWRVTPMLRGLRHLPVAF